MDAEKKLKNEEMKSVTGGSFTDVMRTCRQCGNQFLVTAGEQEYEADTGAEICICKNCRILNAVNSRARKKIYEVTCPRCHQTFKSPFEPLPGQVLYCSECFSAMRQ